MKHRLTLVTALLLAPLIARWIFRRPLLTWTVRSEADEAGDGLPRAALRAGLKHTPQKDQGDDDRGGFEVNFCGACGEDLGGEGGEGGIAPGSGGAWGIPQEGRHLGGGVRDRDALTRQTPY